MISLLSAEDMYPLRLVAIRPENENHSLPSLVSEPTTQDFEQSKKTKKEVPDYMKSISTGVNDRKAQQAKYRAQVAEQRKRLLSRERRTKERKRLNKRADLVKKKRTNHPRKTNATIEQCLRRHGSSLVALGYQRHCCFSNVDKSFDKSTDCKSGNSVGKTSHEGSFGSVENN